MTVAARNGQACRAPGRATTLAARTACALFVATFAVGSCAAAAAPQGSMVKGRQIAEQGVGSHGKVPECANCHGTNGAGGPASQFARLAGQSSGYLAKELHDFASGKRKNAIMHSIASALSPEDVVDVAAYFSSVAAPATPVQPEPDPAELKLGERIATAGDAPRRVQGCDNCHGAGGSGESPLIPYLAGQNASYLGAQLQAWANRDRDNDQSGTMPIIAKRLTEQEVRAVAAWYATQPVVASDRVQRHP